MPRTRTTKKLAQRIDLDYFKRSSPPRRWRFLLSVAAPALAILWIAWYGVRSDRRVYSAGNLSTAHAVLAKQCSACHLSNLGFYDAKVIDLKCLTCHDGPLHHATQVFTPACASCHADHRGAIRLAATSDANCTQCHADLATRESSTKILSATSEVLKIITPSSLCCDPSAVIREAFNSIIISICSRIFSDRVAAACRWFAPTVIARRRTPAARGLMGILKARPALRKTHP